MATFFRGAKIKERVKPQLSLDDASFVACAIAVRDGFTDSKLFLETMLEARALYIATAAYGGNLPGSSIMSPRPEGSELTLEETAFVLCHVADQTGILGLERFTEHMDRVWRVYHKARTETQMQIAAEEARARL